jgi:hypothetical protein
VARLAPFGVDHAGRPRARDGVHAIDEVHDLALPTTRVWHAADGSRLSLVDAVLAASLTGQCRSTPRGRWRTRTRSSS